MLIEKEHFCTKKNMYQMHTCLNNYGEDIIYYIIFHLFIFKTFTKVKRTCAIKI